MNEMRRRRFGGGAGIVFVILLVVQLIFGPGDPPGFDQSAEEVAAYVADNRGELQAAMALTIAAAPVFLVFLAALARELRVAEGRPPGMLAALAFAGGILVGVFAVTGWGLQWAASYHQELDPGLVQALWDAGNVAFLAAAGVGFTTLIGAASAVALSTGALPRALGAYGALLAVYSFVVAIVASFSETGAFSPADGALGFIAFFAFLIWVLLTGGALAAGAGGREQSEPARA